MLSIKWEARIELRLPAYHYSAYMGSNKKRSSIKNTTFKLADEKNLLLEIISNVFSDTRKTWTAIIFNEERTLSTLESMKWLLISIQENVNSNLDTSSKEQSWMRMFSKIIFYISASLGYWWFGFDYRYWFGWF